MPERPRLMTTVMSVTILVCSTLGFFASTTAPARAATSGAALTMDTAVWAIHNDPALLATNGIRSINPATGAVGDVVEIPAPAAIAMSPDARTVFVVSGTVIGPATLRFVDAVSGSVIDESVPVGNSGVDLDVTPDGTSALVTNWLTSSITVVDLASRQVTDTITLPFQPRALTISPYGHSAWVASSEAVHRIDLNTHELSPPITVGPIVHNLVGTALTMTPNGSLVLVALDSGSVALISTADHSVMTIPTASQPRSLVVTVNSATAYYATAEGIGRIDLNSRQALWRFDAHRSFASVALSPPGDRLVAVSTDRVGTIHNPTTGHVVDTAEVPLLPGALVASPDQAPRSDFIVTQASVGNATTFDASLTTIPFGWVVRYDWDFGDGTTKSTDEPIITHEYRTPGQYQVTLKTTSRGSTSTGGRAYGGGFLRFGGPEGTRQHWIAVSSNTVRKTKLFTNPGAAEQWTVPFAATGLGIHVRGGDGEDAFSLPGEFEERTGWGGSGETVTGYTPVGPRHLIEGGDRLTVSVGAMGGIDPQPSRYAGGRAGAGSFATADGGEGGGGSAVIVNKTIRPLIIASGGGGGGGTGWFGRGGSNSHFAGYGWWTTVDRDGAIVGLSGGKAGAHGHNCTVEESGYVTHFPSHGSSAASASGSGGGGGGGGGCVPGQGAEAGKNGGGGGAGGNGGSFRAAEMVDLPHGHPHRPIPHVLIEWEEPGEGTAEPVITSPDSATVPVGGWFSLDLSANGWPLPSYSASLPNWLYFVQSGPTGWRIVGSPPPGSGGVHTFDIHADNGYQENCQHKSAQQTFTLTVPEAPVIVSDSVIDIERGQPVDRLITTSGHPAVFSITIEGSLPTGLAFRDLGDGTARLSGTPTTEGVHSLQIVARNGETTRRALEIRILPGSAVDPDPDDHNPGGPTPGDPDPADPDPGDPDPADPDPDDPDPGGPDPGDTGSENPKPGDPQPGDPNAPGRPDGPAPKDPDVEPGVPGTRQPERPQGLYDSVRVNQPPSAGGGTGSVDPGARPDMSDGDDPAMREGGEDSASGGASGRSTASTEAAQQPRPVGSEGQNSVILWSFGVFLLAAIGAIYARLRRRPT